MNNSISLIGMAGAGKSSVGLELAKQLKINFKVKVSRHNMSHDNMVNLTIKLVNLTKQVS